MRNKTKKCIYRYANLLYYKLRSVQPKYHRTSKQLTNIKCLVLNEGLFKLII